MTTATEFFVNRAPASVPAKAAEEPRSDKAATVRAFCMELGLPTNNERLNAWLTRHVGTTQIMKGMERAPV